MSCMGVMMRADLTGNGHPIVFCTKGLDDRVLSSHSSKGNPWHAGFQFIIFHNIIITTCQKVGDIFCPVHIPGLLHSVTDCQRHDIQNNHHLSKRHHSDNKHWPRSSSFFFVNLALSKYFWKRTLNQFGSHEFIDFICFYTYFLRLSRNSSSQIQEI